MVTDFILGLFSDDRERFARFVADDLHNSVFHAAEVHDMDVLDAIDLVLAEAAARNDKLPKSLPRVMALLIGEEMEPAEREILHHRLGLDHPKAARTALRRSQQAAADHPEIVPMLAAATSLLASRSFSWGLTPTETEPDWKSERGERRIEGR